MLNVISLLEPGKTKLIGTAEMRSIPSGGLLFDDKIAPALLEIFSENKDLYSTNSQHENGTDTSLSSENITLPPGASGYCPVLLFKGDRQHDYRPSFYIFLSWASMVHEQLLIINDYKYSEFTD